MATRKRVATVRRPKKARKAPAKRKATSVLDRLHLKGLQKDIKKAANMAVADFQVAVAAIVKNHAKKA